MGRVHSARSGTGTQKSEYNTRFSGLRRLDAVSQLTAPVESRVPFLAFSNPFADGTADGRSPEELVRYSFEALEAWAGDRDAPRQPDETPLEFAARLGDQFVWLRPDSRRLALLVARMAYAEGNLPADSRSTLEHFWERLTSGADETVDEVVEVEE